MSRLFLLAYTSSGLAGLIYQVCWTRLLTLYIGHTTAAASAVVAAFLGGLAVGAAAGGTIAARLSPRRSLQTYAALEVAVAGMALIVPIALGALTPVLQWAYADGSPGILFPAVRLASCLVLVFIPAAALGATFPMAIRWLARESGNHAETGGLLYALNTTGAAVGALAAGFVLIPSVGLNGTTRVAIAASVLAAVCAWWASGNRKQGLGRDQQGTGTRPETSGPREQEAARLAMLVLGISGFAALLHEIVWTRIVTLVLGPTIYAFAGTLAAVVAGVALGSAVGTVLVGRVRRPAGWLAGALLAAAITSTVTAALAGGWLPRLVAQQLADGTAGFDRLLLQGLLVTVALIVPSAACLGAAFPLALALITNIARAPAKQFAAVYAVNTIGAVLGSLVAGFVLIPQFGLQLTLVVVSACLIVAAMLATLSSSLRRRDHMIIAAGAAVAAAAIALAPPWDRELLASGAYMYAPYVAKDLDLETQLKAGTLLYYREGAAATVSVKRLTGTTTLAVDGKTDASNRSDMLTQKLAAHLPLLLHDTPRTVGIIGLGSGVTVGAALRHPVERVDVIEISPEVVEASDLFAIENNDALNDPRTRLIVADGRSHLQLARQYYDVLISEPSNPWIAGVAALFTREFFVAARARLAPGGIICQWANAYNISDADLRAIVATFQSVFPDGTAWLVGGDDLLLIASTGNISARLAAIERHWSRAGVAADLNSAGAMDAFALWSLYVAGPDELRGYAAGATLLTDDRMSLEFSAPRELHRRTAGENGVRLAALVGDGGPAVIREARRNASAAQWRSRGVMMAQRDAHAAAYDDFVHALSLDSSDQAALDGLVRSAILTKRGAEALAWVRPLVEKSATPAAIHLALSKLHAAIGAASDAQAAAQRALEFDQSSSSAVEQLAALAAAAGDRAQLNVHVQQLRTRDPDSAATHYYAAVSALLHERPDDAVQLAERAIAVDRSYAAVYDLLGAALTKRGDHGRARVAFETSLHYDAHDSTAYTNLGVLALGAGDRSGARNYFAEALWLDPDSATARRGLSQTR